MKRTAIIFLAAATAFCSAAPAYARQGGGALRATEAAIPASLAALLQTYPAGGDGLSAAIADVLTNDAGAAAAVVALAKKANPDQKAAIALGILRAVSILRATNQEGARFIRSTVFNSDPALYAILVALEARLYADSGFGRGNTVFFAGGGGFSSGGGGGGIVSRPFFVSPN